jgi:ribosome maturation factor RimP
MSSTDLRQRLLSLIEPVCLDAGCELVDVRLVMEQGGWVLRVCIDRPLPDDADLSQVHEERVDLAECERMSRLLSAVLDVEDPVPQAYNLEVSSPGIDRPLRTAAHFTRYAGAEAKIQLDTPVATPSGGERRNFRGVLRGVRDDRVLIDVDGQRFELPLPDIDTARLVPDWDDVMRGGSGVVPAQRAAAEHGGKRAAGKRKDKTEGGPRAAAGGGGRADARRGELPSHDEGASTEATTEATTEASNASSNAPFLNNSADVPAPGNR